jgi:hypothetical protein
MSTVFVVLHHREDPQVKQVGVKLSRSETQLAFHTVREVQLPGDIPCWVYPHI